MKKTYTIIMKRTLSEESSDGEIPTTNSLFQEFKEKYFKKARGNDNEATGENGNDNNQSQPNSVDMDETEKERRRRYAIIRERKRRENRPKTEQPKKAFTRCYRCGDTTHKANHPGCPAKNNKCNWCEKIGHYPSVCMNEQVLHPELDPDFINKNSTTLIDSDDDKWMNEAYDEIMKDLERNISTSPSSPVKEVPAEEYNLNDNVPKSKIAYKDIENAIEEETNIKEETSIPRGAYVITNDEADDLWTFVYRGPEPIFKKYKGDVIIINHSDHYHFVFKSMSQNLNRTLGRIFEGGNMPITNLSEAKQTCIKVQSWKNYCPYLVRKNNKVTIVGNNLKKLYIDLMNAPQEDRNCADINREIRRKPNNFKGTTAIRRDRLESIYESVQLKDARQIDEFERMNTLQDRINLYTEHGPAWKDAAKLAIEIYNEELLREQSETPYEEYDGKHKDCEEPTDFSKSNKWFDGLLETNNIDKEEFISALINVMNKKIRRKNCFALVGGTTTGKSLILKLICSEYNYGTVKANVQNLQFYFQNLVKKTVALMEEPRIIPMTVNSFKQLLGGEEFDIEKKYSDDVRLHRLPVLISSNHELNQFILSVDADAIYARTFQFRFIKRLGVDYDEPPEQLCSCHFKHWYRTFLNDKYETRKNGTNGSRHESG